MTWPAGTRRAATPGNHGRPLSAPIRNTLATLSLLTHAKPEWVSLAKPHKKYVPAVTTSAVRTGQPCATDGRRSRQRRTTGPARNGTHTNSRRTSLWRILPRLVRSPARTSRLSQAVANARRRARAETRATTAASVPTTWSPTIAAADGMPSRNERNHTGRKTAAGTWARRSYGPRAMRSPSSTVKPVATMA